MDPITIAFLASQAIGGIGKGISSFQQAQRLKERGRAISEYYNNQIRSSRIASGREVTKTLGTGQAAAGARGVAFDGSTLEATMDSVFEVDIKGAFQRAELRQRRDMAIFDNGMQVAAANGQALGAAVGTFSGIFKGLGDVKETPAAELTTATVAG